MGEVDRSEVELVLLGIHLFDEFRKSLDVPERPVPLVIHMDSDLDRIVLHNQRRYGWPIDTMRKYWEDRWIANDKNEFMIHALEPGEQPGSRSSERGIGSIAHDLVHAALQHGLLGISTDPKAFERYKGIDEPRWLSEGMATLMHTMIVAEERGITYSDARIHWVSFTKDADIPLRDAEIHPANQPSGVILRYDRRQIIDCTYRCGALAAELLASHVGLSKLSNYWMELETRMVPLRVQGDRGWTEAFERAYGMTVEEFYELFEEHRAAGFPEMDIGQ
ncbi:MAG: hypothetical protein F4W95_06945 [Chloroflexi bacterium]|nr:hypothetical protein [Chloroflexota bacterium]MYD48206.1 hypothetical protein [Chloroflexota bacterium]